MKREPDIILKILIFKVFIGGRCILVIWCVHSSSLFTHLSLTLLLMFTFSKVINSEFVALIEFGIESCINYKYRQCDPPFRLVTDCLELRRHWSPVPAQKECVALSMNIALHKHLQHFMQFMSIRPLTEKSWLLRNLHSTQHVVENNVRWFFTQ